VPLNIFWGFPEFILHWKILSEKNKTYPFLPGPSPKARPSPPRPSRRPAPGPPEPIWGPAKPDRAASLRPRRRRSFDLGVRAQGAAPRAPIKGSRAPTRAPHPAVLLPASSWPLRAAVKRAEPRGAAGSSPRFAAWGHSRSKTTPPRASQGRAAHREPLPSAGHQPERRRPVHTRAASRLLRRRPNSGRVLPSPPAVNISIGSS
jgi:hypothetical protein